MSLQTETERLREFALDCEEMVDQIERALAGDIVARRRLSRRAGTSRQITLTTRVPMWNEIDIEATR